MRTVQRLTAGQIEDRLSHIPDDVLEDIENDVLFNYDKIMLPWFEKGLYWNDEPGFVSPNELRGNNNLPESEQWKELEKYCEEMQISVEQIYQILWMFPTWKRLWHSFYEYDRARMYLTHADKSVLSAIWLTKRWIERLTINIESDIKRSPLHMRIEWKDALYYLRLQAG